MAEVDHISLLRKRAQNAKVELEVCISKRNEIMERLKKEHSVDSIEQALALAEKTEKQIAKLSEDMETLVVSIEEKLNEFERASSEG